MHSYSRIGKTAEQKTSALVPGLLVVFSFSTLAIVPAAQADTFNYQIDVVGGSIALQGTSVPITLYNQLLSGTPGDPNDNVAVRLTDQASGQPLPYGGIDFTCPHPAGLNTTQCTGTYPNYAIGGFSSNVIDGYLTNAAPTWMNLVISSTATPGLHTIVITGTSFEGLVRTTKWTVNVVSAAQLALTKTQLAPAVPVPQRARWENDMAIWGRKWCPNINPQNFNTDLTQSIMFYDGARVYYQMGDYTGNTDWYNCAHTLAVDYYPYISSGSFFGFNMFSRGLLTDTQRTGNANSAAGVAVLAQTSSWSYGNPEYMTDPTSLREDAYGLEALLDNQTLNNASYPLLQQAASALLGALDQIFIQKRFTWYQPFMVGLATEALIQYNSKYPDPRIPYMIKQTLDGMWNAAWRPDLHGFYYRCYATNLVGLPPDLPPGNNGCFDDDTPQGGADSNAWPIPAGDTFDYNDGQPNLNNLVSPAYAWMYLQTGDTKYRQEADRLFADGVLYNGAINYAGKEFSQNYRWTFDFMNWRDQANSQGASAVSDTEAPHVSMVAPASGITAGNTLSIIADASDNVYVTGVQFQADGVNLGPPVTSMPFEQINLPTYLLSNGAHSITAIAYDAAGNSAVSAPITITVSNTLNASVSQCPSTNIPTGAFQGCYYQYTGTNIWNDVYNNNAMTPPPPPTLGTLVTVTTDPAINFDWGSGAPAPGVSSYQFIVVWQGRQTFNPGMYTFTTSVDGNTGIRVYIDGQMVENQWWPSCGDTSSQNNCPQKFTVNFLRSGPRLIRVETFHVLSANNFDSVHVSWSNSGLATPAAVSSTLTASTALVKPGQPVTLTWSSTNAANVGSAIPDSINNSTGCAGTNFSTGTYANLGGSVTVTPSVATTYSVTCYGPAGSGTSQFAVRISAARR